MFHETEVLGKYINPCFLKPKVKTRVKSRPLQLVKEAHKIPDFPEEFAREKYHAPPGSKENFTCRNCPDITAADKALDDVSIFMNSRTIRNAPHGDLNNFSSLTEQLVKNLEGDVDCLADDYEWTKFHLHRGSSLQFSESESEADPLASIAEFKNFEDVMARDASSKLRSSETGDGIDYPNEDCQSLLSSPPAKENLTIEIINMTKDKPHIVRRIIKESQSVSEWLEEKIISVHSDSCLEKYRPPSLYEMTKSGSTLQPKLRHETYKALKAKSCCTFGCKSESSEFLLQTTKPDSTISDKSLDILKQRSKCHNVTPLTAINSVDDVLQLRTVNPVGFCIWRALCSKKLDLYAYKSECRPHSIDEFDTQASICKFKKFSARRLSRGDDESDQTGYLGSEEDEEYKCQILNDFWPIRSQCTTKDSEPSIPDFSKDLHAVNRDQNQSAAPANIIFIDCDGSEYWSCKSAYEDIFYPFHAHVQNSDDGRTTFSLHNNNGNADSCKIRKQSHIQQTRLGRCISKLATWCKNGLLKNL
ncbi:uncharacterized protein LOC118435036 [Folsomia candida]|nr:uncharacterized protein LOC118435036 [Folsomia candida]